MNLLTSSIFAGPHPGPHPYELAQHRDYFIREHQLQALLSRLVSAVWQGSLQLTPDLCDKGFGAREGEAGVVCVTRDVASATREVWKIRPGEKNVRPSILFIAAKTYTLGIDAWLYKSGRTPVMVHIYIMAY